MNFLREVESNETLKMRIKDSVDNLMKELTEEQKQLMRSSQISQTNQNSNIDLEDTEFDDHLESQLLQPIRFCHIYY